MKLEVGMYVRTKKGEIDKILHIDYADERRKKYPTHPSNKYWRDKMLLEHKGYRVTNQSIIKASHNIIDLIEVGDVIVDNSGRKIEVNLIRIWNDVKEVICNDYNLDDSAITLHNSDIFKILTKEQFENNCYKMGD